MPKPNLDKADRKPVFSTPPAAAPGLKGNAPLPPGKPMVLKKVSPGERAVLERFGWKDGDPVPDNLAELIEEADIASAPAFDLDNLPPPGSLRTPALKLPVETDVSELPLAEQDKYAQVLAALSDTKLQAIAAEELQASLTDNNSINDAIRAAATSEPKITLVDDTDSDTYSTGTKKRTEEMVDAKEEDDEPRVKYCRHCGHNQAIKDVIEVTEVDKIGFLQTLLGLQPFAKEYKLYGGRFTLQLRTLLPEEMDTCFRQVFTDRQKNRTTNPAEEAEHLARYKASLQVVRLTGPGLNYVAPQEHPEAPKGDTYVYQAWLQFQQDVDRSETLHRILLGTVNRFNLLVSRLEDNADNENFWPAID
jgi:hypothetical protein